MPVKVHARCASTPTIKKPTVGPGSVCLQSPRLWRAPLLRGIFFLGVLSLAISAGAHEDDYFARVDHDGDGRISLDEFLLKMGWAFSQRDLNADGILQPGEQHYAGAKPITIAEHHARFTRQFHRQDGNGDGFLSRREFLAPPQ